MFSDSIYERTGSATMTREGYIRAVAFFTLLEALFVAAGSMTTYAWQPSWVLIVGSFIVSIVCIFIFTGSDNPLISGLGVSGMSLALGAMMGPLVALYKAPVVMEAVVLTAGVMGVMSVLGILFPKTFEGWGPYLMAGLVLLIVAQFGQLLLLALGFQGAAHMPLITWFGVIVFVGLVAFDWSRALEIPYTMDNAIDASGGLILDAVNLFIRILELLGHSKD